jgi:hypothetical protein
MKNFLPISSSVRDRRGWTHDPLQVRGCQTHFQTAVPLSRYPLRV